MCDSYCESGLFNDILVLLEEIKSLNLEPDQKIYSIILSACVQARNLEYGKIFHGILSENNVVLDSYLVFTWMWLRNFMKNYQLKM